MAKSGQVKLSAKGLPFHFLLYQGNLQNRMRLKGPPFDFFGSVRLFLKIFKCPPLSFSLFCNRMYVYKSKRVPFLHFWALCDIFRKKKIQKSQVFFQKKMFCAFRALDTAPTLDVLVLFSITCIEYTQHEHLI